MVEELSGVIGFIMAQAFWLLIFLFEHDLLDLPPCNQAWHINKLQAQHRHLYENRQQHRFELLQNHSFQQVLTRSKFIIFTFFSFLPYFLAKYRLIAKLCDKGFPSTKSTGTLPNVKAKMEFEILKDLVKVYCLLEQAILHF